MKNSLMTLCLMIAMMAAYGQDYNYTVKGVLSGMSDDITLFVVNNRDGKMSFDTLKIEKGEFVYRGTVEKRGTLMLMRSSKKEQQEQQAKWKGKKGMILSGKFDLTLFVSPGAEVEIRGDQQDFPFLEVNGNEEFNRGMMELQQLNLKELKEINRLHFALNETVLAGDTAAKMNVYRQQKALRETIGERTMDWIAAHPDEEYALWLYLRSGLTYKTAVELQEQYNRFTVRVQQSESGQQLAEMIRVRGALLPGAEAPAFTLKNIYTDDDISLADYRGKYVLLDFWASWCGPCRNSHPHLIGIEQKYKADNFVLLGIASDRKDDVIKEAAGKDGITWPQMNIYEKRSGQKPMSEMYDISALPTKILIDPQGKIVARYIGDVAEIDTKLKEIFGK